MLEVFTFADVEEIDQRLRTIVGPGSSPEYTVEPMPFGIPVVLVYRGGSLSGAAVMKDPLGGQDVTRNIKTILSVPLTIDPVIGHKRPPERLEVWGIVYDEGSAEKHQDSGLTPERSVAQSLIEADLKVAARRPLNLFCYGALQETALGGQIGVSSHYELVLQLQDWGFRVNRPQISRCTGMSALTEKIRWIEERRGQSPYRIGGALLQVNPLPQRSSAEAAWGHEGVFAYGFKPINENDSGAAER